MSIVEVFRRFELDTPNRSVLLIGRSMLIGRSSLGVHWAKTVSLVPIELKIRASLFRWLTCIDAYRDGAESTLPPSARHVILRSRYHSPPAGKPRR